MTTSAGVTLNIADPNALPYTVGTVTQTCDLGTYCIPVAVSTTNPVDNVIGYDLTMSYDATRLQPTGNITVFNNLVNSSYVETASAISTPGTLNISLYFNGTAPGFTEFNGTGDIFCVEFTRLAAFEPIDAAAVSVPFLQESYIGGVQTRAASAGQAISEVSSAYVSTLEFWSDNSPISYDVASPNTYLITNIYGVTGTTINNPLTPVQPDVNGVFTHDLSNGTKISIERDINNGVIVQLLINAADAVLAKTLLLNGAFTPSVYQALSLDVNLDGVISAGDVSQIKQRATLAIGEFQQAWNYDNQGNSNGQLSKDWIFVDQTRVNTDPAYLISTTFPANDLVGYSKGKVPVVPFYLDVAVTNYTVDGSTCPDINTEIYKGILLGDVNASYASFVADGILKSTDSDFILVDLNAATFVGNTAYVPVSISSSADVNALDLALSLDDQHLAYSNTEDVQMNSESESFYNVNDKTIRYSGFNLDNFRKSTTAVMMAFETTDGKISEDDFSSTLGLLNGMRTKVLFAKEAAHILNTLSIYPNPSNGQFSIVAGQDGKVDVTDMTGNLVHEGVIVKGGQLFQMNMSALSNGVYFVRFYDNNTVQTQRIVINK